MSPEFKQTTFIVRVVKMQFSSILYTSFFFHEKPIYETIVLLVWCLNLDLDVTIAYACVIIIIIIIIIIIVDVRLCILITCQFDKCTSLVAKD